MEGECDGGWKCVRRRGEVKKMVRIKDKKEGGKEDGKERVEGRI